MSFFRGMLLSVLGLVLVGSCEPGLNTQVIVQEDTWESSGIVGGQAVDSQDPIARSTVALYWNMRRGAPVALFCTGTLIGPRHILTAAHCLEDLAKALNTSVALLPNRIRVGFGAKLVELSWDQQRRLSVVQQVYVHPAYRAKRLNRDFADIAIIEMRDPAPGGFVPVPLAGPEFLQRGQRLIVAGFGKLESGASEPSKVLQKIKLTLANPQYSGTQFTHRVHLSKSPCSGDSGGPAYVDLGDGQLAVLGVVSWTVSGCFLKGAYTSVPVFSDWIRGWVR